MTMSFLALRPVKGWEKSHSQMTTSFRVVSSNKIVILILQLIPTDIKQRITIIHFAHCIRSVADTRRCAECRFLSSVSSTAAA